MILVISEDLIAADVFLDNGFVPVRYSHWAVNTGQMTNIGARIKNFKYKGVWVEFPKLDNKGRRFAHMTCLLNWASNCRETGTPFVLIGSFGGRWNDP